MLVGEGVHLYKGAVPHVHCSIVHGQCLGISLSVEIVSDSISLSGLAMSHFRDEPGRTLASFQIILFQFLYRAWRLHISETSPCAAIAAGVERFVCTQRPPRSPPSGATNAAVQGIRISLSVEIEAGFECSLLSTIVETAEESTRKRAPRFCFWRCKSMIRLGAEQFVCFLSLIVPSLACACVCPEIS